MPFQSVAQRSFFNSPGAKKAGLTKKQIDEWNKASKGQKGLPEHAAKKKEKDARKKIGKADRAGIHRWVE
jgi:hypothetical protein